MRSEPWCTERRPSPGENRHRAPLTWTHSLLLQTTPVAHQREPPRASSRDQPRSGSRAGLAVPVPNLRPSRTRKVSLLSGRTLRRGTGPKIKYQYANYAICEPRFTCRHGRTQPPLPSGEEERHDRAPAEHAASKITAFQAVVTTVGCGEFTEHRAGARTLPSRSRSRSRLRRRQTVGVHGHRARAPPSTW